MKRTFVILLQFFLMLIVFFVGSILPVFHILPLWAVTHGPDSIFVLDGLYLLIFLYMLFLVMGVLRRRFFSAAFNSTVALVLALFIGLVSRFPIRSV
jgi:hypothetical protein